MTDCKVADLDALFSVIVNPPDPVCTIPSVSFTDG